MEPTGEASSLEGQPQSRRRKRILRRVIGTVVLVLLATAGACTGCYVSGSNASREGATYAESAMAAIGQAWDVEVFLDRVDPGSSAAFPRDKTDGVLSYFRSRLGSIRQIGVVRSTGWRTYVGSGGFAVFSGYVTDCEFEKASGNIQMTLVRRGGKWGIQGFRVNSDALLK